MNEVALQLPTAASFDEWLSIGRELAGQKRTLDWKIGDWLNHGQERFPEQLTFALTAICEDPKPMRKAAAIAAAFPASQRDASLSYEHHAHVAGLPADEAMGLLKRAKQNRWSARQTRIEAMNRKTELGQVQLWDKDPDDAQLEAICHAWNRAAVHVRNDFIELQSEAGTGDIDP
jgi:hypothetical protein